MVHIITFEFVGPRMADEDSKLGTAIKALGPCYSFHRSVWLVESELTNKEITDRLRPLLRPKDRLLATRIHRDWVSANIAPIESDWLGSRNFSSRDDDPGIVRSMQMARR